MSKDIVRMKKHFKGSLISMVLCGLLMTLNSVRTANAAARIERWHGLTVSPGGVLEKDGLPYRGIGVNFVGALRRLLINPKDPSIPRDFKELKAYHVPFVRFPALAVWGTPPGAAPMYNMFIKIILIGISTRWTISVPSPINTISG